MIIRYRRPKGTHDTLPEEVDLWLYIESVMRETAQLYGFRQIRFPVFENTSLFTRGVGEGTDIVQKEMYTFTDKDGSSLTLRPEGTACVARSVIENGLYSGAMPLKLYYISSFYRRERPQAGRSREFYQFGTELFGSDSPSADATVIMLAHSLFNRLGLKNVKLKINSIGCPHCRKNYRAALDAFLEKIKGDLCPTCLGRSGTNPMRVLDCKEEKCRTLTQNAPATANYLCQDCGEHFDSLKTLLDKRGIEYEVDPRIVRGLDYYTKTVFEFINPVIGAQSTVCGGGRYDGLIEELGGQALSGIGFGMGISRLIQSMKAEDAIPTTNTPPKIFIAPLGSQAEEKAFVLAEELRAGNVFAETDLLGRSLKSQMKYADKIGAENVLVIGENELETNSGILQNMANGEKIKVDLSFEGIIDNV